MRLYRIHVRNFKGVDDAQVEFSLDGVTIVEGPNEVGKTSLAEALSLALEQPDSSQRAEIRAAKPVHADVGPWVEIELSTGTYRIVLEKRWLRSPMTHLKVLTPKAEELTGREAHDRVRAILAETLDEQLFLALRYEQGTDIRQAVVGGCPSLATALDAAASGQALSGPREATLIDLVEEERKKFFTATGRAIAERTNREGRLSELRQDLSKAQSELESLDDLAEEHRRLTAHLAELKTDLVAQSEALEREVEAADAVEKKKLAVAEQEVPAAVTTATLDRIQLRAEDRSGLCVLVETTASSLDDISAAVEKDEPTVTAVNNAVDKASERRANARLVHLTTRTAEEHARHDVEYFQRTLNLELWRERLESARAGTSALAEAESLLESSKMDQQHLDAIEAAAVSVTEARARLTASSAMLKIEAVAELALAIEGDSTRLGPGEVFETSVQGQARIGINDIATVIVTGGAPERDLQRALSAAEDAFREALRDADVSEDSSVAQCRIAAQERRDAQGRVDQARTDIARAVRDLTIERLEQEVLGNQEFLATYVQSRPDESPLPSAAEEAEKVLAAAEAALAKAAAEEQDADVALTTALSEQAQLQEEIGGRVTQLSVERSRHADAVEALRLAREQQTDEDLERELREATDLANEATDNLSALKLALDELDPASVEARLSNARGVVARLGQESTETELKLAGAVAVLAVKGEAGLQDARDLAATKLEQLERENDRIERMSAAVDLLWRTLTSQREAAQRSYVAPYRLEIERLGRVLYGPGFSVGIGHTDLAIESRTLDGRTVPYDSLSSGAKEQLCVISRLACAAIVSDGELGGCPVIIDDALGWSDPDRLARMGAAFSAASSDCQVIVFTCDPSRYRGVGNTIVRHLEPVTGAIAEG